MLLQYLGIDTKLPKLGPAGLPAAYQKYKAIINASAQVIGLSKDDEWKAQFSDLHVWTPGIVDFINIFIAKSQYYNIWKPLFGQAQEYPSMKDWLNSHPDKLSTKKLWGFDSKKAILFVDLKNWLDEKDREGKLKQYDKGKRKISTSPTKSKKKHDGKDSTVLKRKHKKRKVSREVRDSDESV